MNHTISKKSLAKQVRGALKPPIDKKLWDALWECLARRGYLDTPEYSVEEIIEEAKLLIGEFGDSFAPRPSLANPFNEKQPRDRKSKPLFLRQQVLSEIIAKEASEDEEVIAFRDSVLDSQKLDIANVDRWMRQKAEEDNLSALPNYKTYEIEGFTSHMHFPGEDKTEDLLEGREFVKSVKAKFDRTMSPDWTKVTVVRGSTIDNLLFLGKSLAGQYGWEVHHACLFVLTGLMPLVPLAKSMSYSIGYKSRANRRITLEIDPMLSEEQVVKLYRKARSRLFKQDCKGRSICRPIGEKALRLAQFYVRQPEDRRAANRMDLWNMEHKNDGDEYDSPGNFNRDCKAAVERLLNPGFGPP